MNGHASPRRWLALAAPLPALLLGALVMRRAGLPAALWGQNLAAGLVLAAVCACLPAGAFLRGRSSWWRVAAATALGLLVATFFNPDSAGVHRWVQAGPLRVHAGAICLPALILALDARLCRPGDLRCWLPVSLVGGVTLILLAAQPDAAQATAFAGALLTLLILRREPRSVVALVGLIAAGMVAWAWKRPDPLRPVPYVEGIVGLAALNGAHWQATALLTLALLPLPFLLGWRNGGPAAPALGTYLVLYLLGSALGAFPVPVMGFGLSPVVGYFIALGWLAARQGEGQDA